MYSPCPAKSWAQISTSVSQQLLSILSHHLVYIADRLKLLNTAIVKERLIREAAFEWGRKASFQCLRVPSSTFAPFNSSEVVAPSVVKDRGYHAAHARQILLTDPAYKFLPSQRCTVCCQLKRWANLSNGICLECCLKPYASRRLEDFQNIRGRMKKYDKEPDSSPFTRTPSSVLPDIYRMDSDDQSHQDTRREMSHVVRSHLPSWLRQPDALTGCPSPYPQMEEDSSTPSINPPEAFDEMDCSYDIEDSFFGLFDPGLYQDSGYSSAVNKDIRPLVGFAASNVPKSAKLSRPSYELHGFAESTQSQESPCDDGGHHTPDVEMEDSHVPSSQKCLWCDRLSGPDGLCDVCFTERTAYNLFSNA